MKLITFSVTFKTPEGTQITDSQAEIIVIEIREAMEFLTNQTADAAAASYEIIVIGEVTE